MSRQSITLKRARFTFGQAYYLTDYGFGYLFVDGRQPKLTAEQADEILAVVPRTGRTAMSIRRQVAELLRAAKMRVSGGQADA